MKTGFVIQCDAFYQTERNGWLDNSIWSENIDRAYVYRTRRDALSALTAAIAQGRVFVASNYEVIARRLAS